MKQRNKHNVKSTSLAVAAAALLGTAPLTAQASGAENYVGTRCTFAFSYCPAGTLPAKGQLLQINQYQALFALLSTTYGGDGRNTFGLPNLQGRVVVATGIGPGGNEVRWGQMDGKESVALTAANLPPQIGATFTGKASGALELPLEGATVTGQTIAGNITVNALNADNPPAGATNIPTATANSIGRSVPANIFAPPGNQKIAVPTTHNLSVTGGTVAGKAKGQAELPVSGNIVIGGGTAAPVATVPPRAGMTV